MWRILVTPGHCACVSMIAALSVILFQASVYMTQNALLPLKISMCMVLLSYILIYKIYSHIILSKNLYHFHSLRLVILGFLVSLVSRLGWLFVSLL